MDDRFLHLAQVKYAELPVLFPGLQDKLHGKPKSPEEEKGSKKPECNGRPHLPDPGPGFSLNSQCVGSSETENTGQDGCGVEGGRHLFPRAVRFFCQQRADLLTADSAA